MIDFKKTYDSAPFKIEKISLAKSFGVSKGTVQNWYKGTKIPETKLPLLVDFFKKHGIEIFYI